MASQKHNDDERRQWVLNDEGLYRMWRSSSQTMTNWVKHNRKVIDEVIDNVTSGKKPQHYLQYGG